MRTTRRTPPILAVLAILTLAPAPARSQIPDIVKRTVRGEIDRTVAGWIRDAVRCALGDRACVERARSSGEKVVIVDDDGEPILDANGDPVISQDEAEAQTQRPGTGAWTRYGFVPGREVWFALDLSDDRPGRFPDDLEYVRGNARVVEVNGTRAVEFSDETTFYVDLPQPLPQGFTLEYAARTGADNLAISTYLDPITEMGVSERAYEGHFLRVWRNGGLYFQGDGVSNTDSHSEVASEFVPVRFQADGGYATMYMGSDEVANVPNASVNRTASRIEFRVDASADRPALLKDLVVAVGLEDAATSLRTTGSFTTRGILFAPGGDRLRPESTPVLEDLRRALESAPELGRVAIEAHTDDRGNDGELQELSRRRAEAVKAYLVSAGIDGGRLDAVGMGATAASADNGSLAGRRQNLRVVVRVEGGG